MRDKSHFCSVITAETADFTAIPPNDEVTFIAGATGTQTMTVTVSTVEDTTGEGDETLLLGIVGVTGPATTGNTQTLLTITDDDSKYLMMV